MKVTTVRFGVDLWGLLDREAAHTGVSVSQYIREAALARAAASAAARGEEPLELLARSHDKISERPPSVTARDHAAEQRGEARALRAQSQQATLHARAVKAKSEEAIARTSARQTKTKNQE
jgi:hypothetical protein